MSDGRAPAAAVLLWLAGRTLVNMVVARLRRLREPRYAIGLLFGVAYFSLILRPRGRGSAAARQAAESWPAEANAFLLLLTASGLAVLLSLLWVFRRGTPSLALSEGEVAFLFPAPLSRRAVIHFALLRPQLGVLFGAFVGTLAFGACGSGMWRTFLGGWLALSTFQFHLQAMSFWKARLAERPAAFRWAARGAVLALAAAAIGAVGWWLYLGTVALPVVPGPKLLRSAPAIWKGLEPWRSGFVPGVLLLPFKAALGPVFAPDGRGFLAALPASLGVLLLNYLWLAGSEASFEEATLASAEARARRRSARQATRTERLPGDRRRAVIPFPLGEKGRPETAVLWKNLLSGGRRSLAFVAGVSSSAVVVLLVLPPAVLRFAPEARPGFLVAATVLPIVAVTVAIFAPLALRQDLRGDLVRAAVLKTWPLRPERLVAAELAAPLLRVVVTLAVAVAATLALLGGLALAPPSAGPTEVPSLPLGTAAAIGAAALLLLPAVAAVALVVQNAAVLAFPAWFPPGEERPTGLEATGMRLLGFFGTALVLALAAIPSALLSAPIVIFLREPLGPVTFPIAALAASMPLWGETLLGVGLLARLWERFDPSLDLSS